MDKLQTTLAQLVSKDDIQLFLEAFTNVVKNTKEDFTLQSEKNIKLLEEVLSIVENKIEDINIIKEDINSNISISNNNIENSKQIIQEIKGYFEEFKQNIVNDVKSKVKDGYTPTEEDLLNLIRPLIPELPKIEEIKLDTGEDIVNKINDLDEEAPKIDAKHISNLPNFNSPIISNSNKYLGQMLDVDLSGLTKTNGKYVLGSGSFTLPVASDSVLGGIKVGSGLSIDINGVLSSSAITSPAGSDTQLQYNNSGAFGGISGATTDGTSLTLTTGNLKVADVKASSSAGVQILGNSGTVAALFGAGGGANSTFYGGSKFDYATASTVPYFDSSKNLVSSSVTPIELGYLSGVTSSIQTQINAKFTLPSLTSGSILFSNGTTIAQDNANFFWDNTNKRLGIGTASPQAIFHSVKSGLNGKQAIFENGSTTPERVEISMRQNGTDYAFFGLLGTTNPYILNTNGSPNDFGFRTENKNIFFSTNFGNSPMVVFNYSGKVGIGTTTPTAKLDVVAGSLTSGQSALNVTGTLNTTTGLQAGSNFTFTSAGSTAGSVQAGIVFTLNAGYTGSATTIGGSFVNAVAGTGNNLNLSSAVTAPTGNGGGVYYAYGTTAGLNYGVFGEAENGNINIGLIGKATILKNSATNIGITGFGLNTGTSPIQIGGYFGLQNSTPTFTSAALISDNGSTTSPIFLARDNGTAVFSIIDGGNVGIGTTTPTAYLHIKAGTATANTAPLKLTSGTLNTTAEAGAIEFLTDAYYGTITTGATRKTFAFLEAPVFTTSIQTPTIELGHASDTTISRVSAGVIAVEGVTVPTISSTNTITNKRNQPRTSSSTTASTLTPDVKYANVFYRTTQTGALTIDAPTGTPVIGETIAIYIDSASSQTLTMDSTYKVFGTAFPASTTAGKTLMITAQYNGTDWKTLWANAV